MNILKKIWWESGLLGGMPAAFPPAALIPPAVPLKDAAHGAWISLPWQEEPARVGSGEPHRNKALGTQGSFPCGAPAGCLFSLSSFWLSPGARHLLPYSALLWQMSARETARPKPSNTDKPLLRPRTKLLEWDTLIYMSWRRGGSIICGRMNGLGGLSV